MNLPAYSKESNTQFEGAEDQIVSERGLQQLLLDHFPGVALLLRKGTREVILSNQAGKDVGAVCGSVCYLTWGQSETTCSWCLAEQLWATGKEQCVEINAGEKVFEAHWVPVTDDLYFHYSFDITDRNRATEKQQERNAVIQMALSISHSFAFDWNVSTDRVIRSDSCRNVFGVDYEELAVATAQRFLQSVHPDDRQRIDKLFRSLTPSADTYTTSFRLIISDGTVVTLEETAQAFHDDAGKIMRILGVATDITARVRAETEKYKLEAKLHQSLKMESVGRLAGGVAHDFNNFLTVILGGAHLALSELEPGQPLYEYVTLIIKAAKKSADLTQQLLAFARKQTVDPKVLDLNDTVSGMLKMLQRLIGENTQLTWQPANNLWLVKADPSQIDQILANLIVNARDSITDIGAITIRTGNSVVDDGYQSEHIDVVSGEYVYISVSDTGCGMEEETLAHIFEPFFTTKGPGEGTGLGLATVYGAAKQNNGFVNVYSEPGLGTTLTIYLPRYVGDTDQKSAKDTAQQAPRGLETILLVEDEPAILNMVTMLLQKQGYKVLAANTPFEATRLACEYSGKIDLLITDVIMPEMNGKSLAHNLLSLNPSLKCLFMSGYTADAISHHGVLEDGLHFIHKPFTLPELAVKVRKVLDGN